MLTASSFSAQASEVYPISGGLGSTLKRKQVCDQRDSLVAARNGIRKVAPG